MKSDVTIMDFTGIYKKERFYRGVHVHWIDCRDIQGTNCYCDEEGEQDSAQVVDQIKYTYYNKDTDDASDKTIECYFLF